LVEPPYLREDLAAALDLPAADSPGAAMALFHRVGALEGEVYRAVASRQTLRFVAHGRGYFLKRHGGVGWGEIFKNLLTLRLPVVGARNEYLTCRHLARLGIPAPRVAAFAERGRNPAARESFVICDALEGFESLEELTEGWETNPPAPELKRRLVVAVARFARAMHEGGVVHRDFYICHLLVNRQALRRGEVELAVIDLHRAQIHRQVPRRWRRRDLAALLFSVLDLPVERSAWLRFVRIYRGRPLREVWAEEGRFWDDVYARAVALYRKGQRRGLVKGRFQP
jgi:heptose I phosphotransferase